MIVCVWLYVRVCVCVCSQDASSAATSSTTDNLESEKHLWFDVEASRFEDPDTGEDVILLVQTGGASGLHGPNHSCTYT